MVARLIANLVRVDVDLELLRFGPGDVRMSTSTAVQAPIAVSSRSTAVKSVPAPYLS
jgi:hypothetical protein